MSEVIDFRFVACCEHPYNDNGDEESWWRGRISYWEWREEVNDARQVYWEPWLWVDDEADWTCTHRHRMQVHAQRCADRRLRHNLGEFLEPGSKYFYMVWQGMTFTSDQEITSPDKKTEAM